MRFHVVALPHTLPSQNYSWCAYTQKVVRFCQMMRSLGHHVTLYAGDGHDTAADEHVACPTALLEPGEDVDWDAAGPLFEPLNATVIREVRDRRDSDRDIVALITGTPHRPILDAFPEMLCVEYGIGYEGTASRYRVFESYAWMHMHYGRHYGLFSCDGNDFAVTDAVIPNQVDENLFPLGAGDGCYMLYLGRLTDRKGWRTAQTVCETLGVPFVAAGDGGREFDGYGEHVGQVAPDERADLLGAASAVFCPSWYVEPFCTVGIEAQACGTPVIATDWGAFAETIEHGVSGYRCRTLAEFVRAAERAEELDRRAIRYRALDLYGMSTVRFQYEAYFERLETLWGDGWATLPAGRMATV